MTSMIWGEGLEDFGVVRFEQPTRPDHHGLVQHNTVQRIWIVPQQSADLD